MARRSRMPRGWVAPSGPAAPSRREIEEQSAAVAGPAPARPDPVRHGGDDGRCAAGYSLAAAALTWLLMRQAAQAAPKPLSMLTTVTPLAHEVSMPHRAVNPASAAP